MPEAAPPAPAPATDNTEAPEAAEEGAAETAEAKPEPRAEPRRLKLKLPDREEELPEEEVIKRAQKSTAADDRFREAAKMRREAEEMIDLVKSNPREALKKYGHDFYKMAEEAVLEEYQREQMTPQERALWQKQRDIEQREAKVKASEDEKRTAEEQRDFEGAKATLEKSVMGMLEKGKLPKDPFTIARAAMLAQATMEAQDRDVDLEDMIEQIDSGTSETSRHYLESRDDAGLISALGDKLMARIRKADLAKVKGAAAQSKAAPAPKPVTKKPVENRHPDDVWREHMKNLGQ